MKIYKKIGITTWLLAFSTLNGNPFSDYYYPLADTIATNYLSSTNKLEFATKQVNAELERYKKQYPNRFAQPTPSNGQAVDAKTRTAQIRLEQAVALEMYKANLQMVLDQWNKNNTPQSKAAALTEYLAMIDRTISSLLN